MNAPSDPNAELLAEGLERLRQVEEAAYLEAPKWRNDANVRHLGWGRRIKNGVLTNELAVLFFVKEKAHTDGELLVLGTKRIPTHLDGNIPTDVIQSNAIAHDDTVGKRGSQNYDPLVGGCEVANADNHMAFWGYYGTLGTLCWDASSGAPMALSNWHVWADGGDQGDSIIQPGHPTFGDYVLAEGRILTCGGPVLGPVVVDLLDWKLPSTLTVGLAAGAGAAWAAAALADVADPIRRGQLATPPANSNEQTLRENVKVSLTALTDPFPGTRFSVRTKWNYERTTDAASYTHSEDEVQINEHAIGLKHLWTDAAYYSPGQSVRLFAEVMTPREEAQGAADFHVVAQVVQPDEQAKRSVVLAQVPYSEPRWHCVSFECDTPGTGYCTDYPRGAVTFHAPATRLNRVVDVYPLGGDGQSELVLFDGHAVTLPSVAEVTVELVPISNPITVRALSGGTEVSRQTTTGAPLTSTSVTLSTTSGLIDRLEFHGTAAAGLLLKLCYFKPISRIVKSSYYQGSFTLDARAPLGCYKCYLYVQTVNNVPPGTDPALAAQTIGGLPASQNLTSQPTAGGGCAFCMVLDYSFHVIQPEPPPIH